MWVAGLVFASAGAYLRVAADRHYATDVITGAVVGSAIGLAVPYFGHRAHGVRVAFQTEGRMGLALSGEW